tara:strand:+ start:543 stop:758 length:216 start_codon:yes stop_codon:yes gene_type:complete
LKIFKLFSYLLVFVVLIFALAIGSENGHLVSLNLLFVKVELPLAVLVYLAFILGLLTSISFSIIKKIKPKR